MNKHEIALKNKLDSFYPVKSLQGKAIESIDTTRRTVTGVLNTSYFIDHDLDMILPGAVKKSLNENGPKSQAPDNIKYQIDHSLKSADTIGRFDILIEREEKGVNQLYFEGFLPPGVSDNHLIKYQTGLYTQHSIGFRYIDIVLAEKDSEVRDYKENWIKYFPLAMNPEVAEEEGLFFVVKEYKLFEGSVVTFGSNKLTDYLGSKSANKETYLIDLFNRLDFLQTIKGSESKQFELEILQIKQIIKETYNMQPSKKDTLIAPLKKDTQSTYDILKELKKIINK